MTISLRDALRRRKPDKRRERLHPRPRVDLIAAADPPQAGRPVVLLDTNVFILSAAGRLPPAVSWLTERALLFHSSVCLAELATGVAGADPGRSDWRAIRNPYAALIDAVPDTRLIVPDSQIWLEAGAMAGTLARTQNLQKPQRKECLNDSPIYLSAAKAGLPVLTANRDEFDFIQQLAPEGRFIHF